MNQLEKFKQLMRESSSQLSPVKIKQKGDKIIYSKQCSVVQVDYVVEISLEQYLAYKSGALAQDVFKDKSRDEIEFIISGTTPVEWKKYIANN